MPIGCEIKGETTVSLDALRQEIDTIDRELVELLCRRMDCSAAVAAYTLPMRLTATTTSF